MCNSFSKLPHVHACMILAGVWCHFYRAGKLLADSVNRTRDLAVVLRIAGSHLSKMENFFRTHPTNRQAAMTSDLLSRAFDLQGSGAQSSRHGRAAQHVVHEYFLDEHETRSQTRSSNLICQFLCSRISSHSQPTRVICTPSSDCFPGRRGSSWGSSLYEVATALISMGVRRSC